MSETNQETILNTDALENIKQELGAQESLAEKDLHSALVSKNVTSDVAGIYENLKPKVGFKEFWSGPLGKISGLLVGTPIVTRLISEHPSSWQEGARIALDTLVSWSGYHVDKLNLESAILGLCAAGVWIVIPPVAFEQMSKIVGRMTSQRESHEEGKANLVGKTGPNVHIDVGKSDPSALALTRLFHMSNLEVVSFWDERNKNFLENPYWQVTNNDWTNRDTLTRGDIQETKLSVVLVSNGDDVFLSPRKQDATRTFQDMTDNEAIGTVNARDSVRRQLGLTPIHHILVTNPKRVIEIGVSGKSSGEDMKLKTLGEVVKEKHERVHIVDPDELIVDMLARIASSSNLPLEIISNLDRKDEYEEYLKTVVNEHNQKVDIGKESIKARMTEPKDGSLTLSVIYGSTDEDTLAVVETYGDQYTKEGNMVAIINDPEKVNRLPEGTKYICVGTVVAEAVYNKYSDLVKSGKIKI